MVTETMVMEELTSELRAIREDLDFIKEHMVDADSILTEEERKSLDASLKHEREGKLFSLEGIENVRNKV